MKPNFKPAKLTTRVMRTRLPHKKQIKKIIKFNFKPAKLTTRVMRTGLPHKKQITKIMKPIFKLIHCWAKKSENDFKKIK